MYKNVLSILVVVNFGAFILEHVSEIMADICNNNYIKDRMQRKLKNHEFG